MIDLNVEHGKAKASVLTHIEHFVLHYAKSLYFQTF